MRSVFHGVRCALVQLEYDLDPLKSIVDADKATNLRPSYIEMRESCRGLLQVSDSKEDPFSFVVRMSCSRSGINNFEIRFRAWAKMFVKLIITTRC